MRVRLAAVARYGAREPPASANDEECPENDVPLPALRCTEGTAPRHHREALGGHIDLAMHILHIDGVAVGALIGRLGHT